MFGQLNRIYRVFVRVIATALIPAVLVPPLPAFAAGGVSGAIWTTTSTGQEVNENVHYATKDDVYLNGGPKKGSDSLSNGKYYIKITEPDGDVLGSSVNPDSSLSKFVTVSDGKFPELIQLSQYVYSRSSNFSELGYDTTSNSGGEYKVWVSLNDPTFKHSNTKTDNFKINPPDDDENTPPGGDGNTPPGGDGNTPPGGDGNTPPGGDGNTPPGGDGNTPPGNDGNTPPGNNNGGVTPPPSEKVTPPDVVITPDTVPAGDPTITLKPSEKLRAAYAMLPEGRRLNLKFNKRTGIWQGSFLVPFGTPDGPYRIKIFTVNLQGVVRHFHYSITIDNGLPLIITESAVRDNKVLNLKAEVLFPATEVVASIAGETFSLNKDKGFWYGTWDIPTDLPGGSYSVTITAKDGEGHSASSISTIQIDNVLEQPENIQPITDAANDQNPEISIAVNDTDKAARTTQMSWEIPLFTVVGTGMLLNRRRRNSFGK